MKDIKRDLIEYGKKIYDKKLVIGTGGNISARLGNKIYIKASGISLGTSRRSDYNEVDLKTGKAICGEKPCSIEIPMHLACYRSRPDIGAVVHAHPVYSTILSLMGGQIGRVSYEIICAMKSDIPTINYKKAGSGELAKEVAKVIKKHNGALLANHGAIVVGKDIKEAYDRMVALERAARIYVLAKALGKIKLIPKKELKRFC